MRVLIGCECSGTIRRAFRRLGHDAWSCDLLPAEDGGEHIQCDHDLHLLDIVERYHRKRWDLLIAHPPCRFLSSSGLHWTTRGLRDPKDTERAIRFAEALWRAPIARICIENPVGCLSTRSCLGRYSQLIHPYQFGEDASKRTCLWLKALPPLRPTCYIAPRFVDGKPRWANQTDSGQNKLGPSPTRPADRARTYPGIARAMAQQWGKLP